MKFFTDLTTRAKLLAGFGFAVMIMIVIACISVRMTYDNIQTADRILVIQNVSFKKVKEVKQAIDSGSTMTLTFLNNASGDKNEFLNKIVTI